MTTRSNQHPALRRIAGGKTPKRHRQPRQGHNVCRTAQSHRYLSAEDEIALELDAILPDSNARPNTEPNEVVYTISSRDFA